MKSQITNQSKARLLVFVSVLLGYTFACMTKYCFSSAMVFIVDEGYMTNFQTGMITAAFWMVYGVMQIFGGMAADKWRPERLVTVGLLGAGISNLVVYLWYDNYVLTLITWMFNGAVQFGVWPATFKLISAMYTGDRLTGKMAIATLASPTGLLASYVVSAFLTRWQHSFLIGFGGLLLLSALWEIVSRQYSGYLDGVLSTEQTKKSSSAVADTGTKESFWHLACSSGLIIIFCLAFFRSVIDNMKTIVPALINESYEQVNPVLSTLISLIVLFCGAAGPILGSVLSKRIKNEMVIVLSMFLLLIPLSLPTLLAGKIDYRLLVALVALVVLAASCISFFLTTIIAQRFEKWGKNATVAGIFNTFASFGVVAASGFLTWMADRFSWLAALLSLVVMIGVAAVMAAVALPFWRSFKKKYQL